MTVSIIDQQGMLKDAGHDPGPLDGVWGPKTQRAYNDWRAKKYGNKTELPFANIPGKSKLEGVHPDLVRVVVRASQITEQPFRILEGQRTKERQRKLVARGASKTMNSRHIPGNNGLAHAVDLGALHGGQISWSWPLYYKIADAMKQAAKDEGVNIEWGGDWKSFKDGPHYQLPWNEYPA